MNNAMRQNVAAVYVVIAAAICLLWLAPAYQEAKEQEMTTRVTSWYITTEIGNNTLRFDKTDEETCRKINEKAAENVSCMTYTETLGKSE